MTPGGRRQIFDWENTLDKCKMMGTMYVQVIVDSLDEKLHDLHVVNASIENFSVQCIIQVMKKSV